MMPYNVTENMLAFGANRAMLRTRLERAIIIRYDALRLSEDPESRHCRP